MIPPVPPIVFQILFRVIANPLSRLVTLELLSRGAINSSRRTIAKLTGATHVLQTTRPGSKGRLAPLPRYKYVFYATAIQFGIVTGASWYFMAPDVFVDDDYVPVRPVGTGEVGRGVRVVPGFVDVKPLPRSVVKVEDKGRMEEKLWTSVGFPVANMVALGAVIGLVNLKSDFL